MSRSLHRPVLIGLAALLPLLASHPVSAADPVVGNSKLMITGIHAAPDYAVSHTVYASATDRSCRGSGCQRLMRSNDGGHSWSILAARGWSGGDAVPVLAGGRVVLLAPAADGSSVQRSDDGGGTFAGALSYGGAIEPAVVGNSSQVIIVSRDGTWHLYDAATRASESVPGTGASMANVSAAVDGSHAFRAPGATAAFAAGTDPSTGFPLLSRCDATLHCAAPVAMDAARELPVAYPSPRVDADGLVLAGAAPSGALLRSTDGGRTFSRINAGATGAIAVSQIQAVEFTPDFDASAHRGTVYLAQTALDSAHARSVGGVYASRDGGATWSRYGGASALDNGVTAMALTPDGRLFAAYFDSKDDLEGLLCAAPGRAWSDACPAYADGSAAAASHGGSSSPGRGSTGGAAGAASGGTAPGSQAGGTGGGGALSQPSRSGVALAAAGSSGGEFKVLGIAVALVGAVATVLLWRGRRSPGRSA